MKAMTQENKELLLKDLSARLSYGVICDCLHGYRVKVSAVDAEDLTVYYSSCDEWEPIEYCKPYLRLMSSMTEEEETTYRNTWCDPLFDLATKQHSREEELMMFAKAHHDSIVFLLENHFDFLGLISLGLAIEVTEENNPYKE